MAGTNLILSVKLKPNQFVGEVIFYLIKGLNNLTIPNPILILKVNNDN